MSKDTTQPNEADPLSQEDADRLECLYEDARKAIYEARQIMGEYRHHPYVKTEIATVLSSLGYLAGSVHRYSVKV